MTTEQRRRREHSYFISCIKHSVAVHSAPRVSLEMPWLSDLRSRMAVNTCAHDCHIAIFVLNTFITNSNRVSNLIGCIARCNITVFSVTFISWLPLITLNFYFPFTELAASFLLLFFALPLSLSLFYWFSSRSRIRDLARRSALYQKTRWCTRWKIPQSNVCRRNVTILK